MFTNKFYNANDFTAHKNVKIKHQELTFPFLTFIELLLPGTTCLIYNLYFLILCPQRPNEIGITLTSQVK